MWIDRNAESVLARYAQIFPVVLVTGARQVGKTSLLRHAFPRVGYVTLDDPAVAMDAERRPREFLADLKTPSIVDEVQYVPQLLRYLKLIVDSSKGEPGHYLLTGSQVFPLMKQIGESLAGRTGIINLPTLSLQELQRYGVELSLPELEIRGGYPALYQSNEIGPREWFPSYLSTYLERDVRSQLAVGNLRDFYRFLRSAAARSGGHSSRVSSLATSRSRRTRSSHGCPCLKHQG